MKTPTLDQPEAPDGTDAAPTPASVVSAWDRFWFKPIDPTSLGFMRICCGLLVVYVHLCYSYDLWSYLGPTSWLDEHAQNYVRKEMGMYAPGNTFSDGSQLYDKGQFFWSIYYHVNDPGWIVAIHVAFLIVMLLFTAGFCTRVTSVLTWTGVLCYVQRLPTSMFGMDAMMVILVFYLMIGPSGAALSVDRWLEGWWARKRGAVVEGPKPSGLANFTLRLIQVHFCIIYLTSGCSKLLGSAWWNGQALWYTLANWNFAPMRVGVYWNFLVFLCENRWLYEILLTGGAVFTLFTEVGFTFLVWNRRWRWFMISCSILLHLGIGLIMGLVVFSMFMLVMVLAFVPPEAVKKVLYQAAEKGRRWVRRQPAPPQEAARPDGLVLSRS